MSDSKDREAFVSNLIEAKNRLTNAEEELEDHLETIKFLKNQLSN